MDSILTSIKKMLGIEAAYTQFDADIIMHINSVLSVLTQLGIGPATGYYISGDAETWSDYLKDDPRIGLVKSFMYLKVRLLFDPPSGSAAIDSLNRIASEFEWRIQVAADPPNTLVEGGITNGG